MKQDLKDQASKVRTNPARCDYQQDTRHPIESCASNSPPLEELLTRLEIYKGAGSCLKIAANKFRVCEIAHAEAGCCPCLSSQTRLGAAFEEELLNVV